MPEAAWTDCDWCKEPIRYGNASLTLNRNIEQLDRTERHPDGVVTVLDSDVVLTLCANCAGRFDRHALRSVLEQGFARFPAPPGDDEGD